VKSSHTHDVILVGGGIIGVSLAMELRRRGMDVLVLDRGQPGNEASTAAAGMLPATEVEGPPQLSELARQSALLYPQFVHEAQCESEISVDFSRAGAICLGAIECPQSRRLTDAELAALEPSLSNSCLPAFFLTEDFVDPRTLIPALIGAAKKRGVHIHGGSEVTGLLCASAKVSGVATQRKRFHAPVVVNCCGAWSADLASDVPARPVKGHMLALLPARPHPLRHVVRNRETDTYLVPRRNGEIAIGSTVEEAGFDKRVDPDVIQTLHQRAADILPELGEGRIHHSWTGLRPATPDKLPILGEGSLPGLFVATGHFRSGILLAPATAVVMADLIAGSVPKIDLSPFTPARFVNTK
jgi:glycine oxidase